LRSPNIGIKKIPYRNKISNDTKLNTILFADDQVVIAYSEENLQRGLHALHQTLQTFGMKISYQKPKSWLLKEQNQ
jgi:hypothetical protein